MPGAAALGQEERWRQDLQELQGMGARRTGTWDKVVLCWGRTRRSLRFNRLRLCVSRGGIGGEEATSNLVNARNQQRNKKSAGKSARVRLGEAVCKGKGDNVEIGAVRVQNDSAE